MSKVWDIVGRKKDYWTEEGQQTIESLYLVIQKMAVNLSKEELELLYRALNEGKLYEVMDIIHYEIKK